jgi:hypothetical protein
MKINYFEEAQWYNGTKAQRQEVKENLDEKENARSQDCKTA